MTTVLLTGASGFVGSGLLPMLAQEFDVRVASRQRTEENPRSILIGDLDAALDWRPALEGVTAVVHLAGPASESAARSADLRRSVVEGSAALAAQAAEMGVGSFVYASSIKACAERTAGRPISESCTPAPETAYGRAKLAAEHAVMEQFPRAVVLRPPLIHGPGVRGNLGRFMRLLDRDLALPLASFRNKRSVIALDSFCRVVRAVLTTTQAPGGVFHVSDRPSVSTAQLASLLRRGMRREAQLFSLPILPSLAPSSLRDDLEVDDAKFRTVFNFVGADTLQALQQTGAAWVDGR